MPCGTHGPDLPGVQVEIPGVHQAGSAAPGERCGPGFPGSGAEEDRGVAEYRVNEAAVAKARALIDARQYVLDSDWGAVQPA